MYFLVNGKKQYKKKSDSIEIIEPSENINHITQPYIKPIVEKYNSASDQSGGSNSGLSPTMSFLIGFVSGFILCVLLVWIYFNYLK